MHDKLSNLVERTAWAVEPFDGPPLAALSPVPLALAVAAVARHDLPLTHSLVLVPRPFSQLARRCYRLGLDIPRGYFSGIGQFPYYRQRRRRPVHQQCSSRRREVWAARLRRAYWHRVAEVMYWGKVA